MSHDLKKAREAKKAPKQRKSERAKNGGSLPVVFCIFGFFYSNRDVFPTILEPGRGYMRKRSLTLSSLPSQSVRQMLQFFFLELNSKRLYRSAGNEVQSTPGNSNPL